MVQLKSGFAYPVAASLKSHSKKIIGLLFLAQLTAAFTSGCSGKKIVITDPVDLKIPENLAKAFEVKEFSPLPQAVVTVAEVKKTEKKKKKKTVKAKSKKEENSIGKFDFEIPNRRPKVDPIRVGEKIWMDVSWLNTKAGEFLLEVLPFKEINGRRVYDLKGTARTSDLFSLIYKAEDWIQSFVDYEGWFPYKFVLHGDESRHVRNHLELFDHGAKKQYVHIQDYRIQTNETQEEKGYKDLTPFSQDSLSALHYVRNFDLEVGKTIKYPMTTSGSQWELNVIVLAREEVQTKMGYLKAFKTKIETRFNGVLQQQGDSFMWFSDDAFKYPLRFEAKVRIGWVAGIAKKIEPGVAFDEAAIPLKVDPAQLLPTPETPAAKDLKSSVHPKRRHIVWFQRLIDAAEASENQVSKKQ